jgi:hypothetical protein
MISNKRVPVEFQQALLLVMSKFFLKKQVLRYVLDSSGSGYTVMKLRVQQNDGNSFEGLITMKSVFLLNTCTYIKLVSPENRH